MARSEYDDSPTVVLFSNGCLERCTRITGTINN